MIKKHQRFLNLIFILLDAFSLLLAYAGAILVKSVSGAFYQRDNWYIIDSIWMVLTLLIVYYFMDVYTPMRSRAYRKELLIITRAHLAGMCIIFSLLFLYKRHEYSREVAILFASFGFIILAIERFIIRRTLQHLRKKGFNQKLMLIIGAGPVGIEFTRKALNHQDFGYNVIGYLDDDQAKWTHNINGKPVLGGCDVLPRILDERAIDEVVVALPLNAFEKFGIIVNGCENAGVRMRIIPDYNQFLSGNPKIEEFDGIPLLNVRNIPLDDPFNRFFKRVLDVFVSTVAIMLAGPVMICIAIGIKLTSPGPVLFRQERVGLNNQPFDMLKFRSMHIDNDTVAATTWTTAQDPRKTKLGSFLRKTSLDELPQFFNVLFGSMSVVGPRPERPFFVEQFKQSIPKYMVKHQVKPGITGWAQVKGWRGDTSIEKRIECDLYYIENWDPILDLKIMVLTILKGLVNKNAY